MKMRGASIVVLVGILSSLLILTFENCGGSSNVGGSANSASSATQAWASRPMVVSYVPNEIIIKMQDSNSSAALTTWALGAGLTLKNSWPLNNTTHWGWTAPETVAQVRSSLIASSVGPTVVFAEPNYYVQSVEPGSNQILSDSQVQALSTQAQVQTTAPIGESNVWTGLTPGQAKPIIAIIDTGIDLTNQVFISSAAIWVNPNPNADASEGYPDDINGWNWVDGNNNVQDVIGHGTHCAGIVLGVGQNIFANPVATANIQIMPLKFIGPNGGLTSNAISAVYFAVAHGARVISNSWGGGTASMALEDAITYAYNQNVLFVAAAGNSSLDNDSNSQYPANYTVPNVMSIAATNADDTLASFSNYGVNSVNFGAPGVNILSTYIPNSFAYLSGTSMATPFVAGTAIYMMYQRPQLGGFQVKNLILSSADNDPSLQGSTIQATRLNSLAALNSAKAATVNNSLPKYAEQSFPNTLSSTSGPSAGSGGGGCGMVVDLGKNNDDGGGPGPLSAVSLFVPLILVSILRRRATRQIPVSINF